MLHAARGSSNARIAGETGRQLDTVRRWRASSPRRACPGSRTVNAVAARRRSHRCRRGRAPFSAGSRQANAGSRRLWRRRQGCGSSWPRRGVLAVQRSFRRKQPPRARGSLAR
ncbi:hypothetical protein ACH4OO_37450 [Streptomyces lydicus]|uniref:hypothetical protein n=1 Tax=Streptomyces lydicus TaxID=47763 RepID=UPI0037BA5E38